MSYSVKLEKLAKERQESRNIVKQILDYGVTEQQKLDIIFEIALNLENNKALKNITSSVKTFREKINNEEDEDNISSDEANKPKLIL
jgi:NH3-dependent NAD+ synthetase